MSVTPNIAGIDHTDDTILTAAGWCREAMSADNTWTTTLNRATTESLAKRYRDTGRASFLLHHRKAVGSRPPASSTLGVRTNCARPDCLRCTIHRLPETDGFVQGAVWTSCVPNGRQLVENNVGLEHNS